MSSDYRKDLEWAREQGLPVKPSGSNGHIPEEPGETIYEPPHGTNGTVPIGEVLKVLNEKAITAASTEFPEAAWHPLLIGIKDWVATSTDSPFEYIYTAAKALVEVVVGRQVFVHMGRRTYVNSAQVNLGAAAYKKGTPWALINDEILYPYNTRFGIDSNNFRLVRGTGSAEGLLQQFMNEEESTGEKKGPKTSSLVPVPGRRCLVVEEELGYLLVKAHHTATANLREIICQLWDGVNVSPPTRSRRLDVQEPFYCLLAMTTPETMAARLEEDDILSGLLTRFVFYQGTARPPIAWPDPPDKDRAKQIVSSLAALSAHVKDVAKHSHLVKPSDATKAAWEEAYTLLQSEALNAATPSLGTMLARIAVHIMKTALLFAMMSGHSQIEIDDLARALHLGSYWSKTAAYVAGSEMGDDSRRAEHKVLAILERNPGVWISVSELHQKVSGRVKASEFHAAIKSLANLNRLETDAPEGAGKYKLVRLVKEA